MKTSQELWGKTPEGKEIYKYRLTNASGAYVELSSVGAGIVSVVVPDKDGKMENVVLGYDDPMSYFADGPCAGKTPGRFANRIAKGRFTLDGKEYELPINNGPNHLHGGPKGFQNQVWESRLNGEAVEFLYDAEDGEAGYPGNLKAVVRYEWDEDNSLRITYTAESDAPTVVNLTNHTYFNLKGECGTDVLSHVLYIDADSYTPTDSDSIPTGEIRSVKGTAFDFTQLKPIGSDIGADDEQLKMCRGYDHNFCLNDTAGAVITAGEESSGIVMNVYTDMPGVQLYTGNFLDGTKTGKGGYPLIKHAGFCLETQFYPDTPNQPSFPQCNVRAGEVFRSTTRYEFKF